MKQIIAMIFTCMLVCTQAFAFVTWGSGSGVAASGETYPDITFFFTAEANDTTTPYSMGVGECGSSGADGTFNSAVTITNTSSLIGSYALDSPTTVDYISFPISITDDIVFAFYFYIYATTWPDTSTTYDNSIVRLYNSSTVRMVEVQPFTDADTNELNLLFRQDGGAYINVFTDNANLALNTLYAAQVTINSSLPLLKIDVFNASLSLLDSAEHTGAFTPPSAGYTTAQMGSTGTVVDDLYIDNVMIANTNVNFITDLFGGTPLINLTSKPTGACP